MRRVVYALMLAVGAQAAAAQESRFLPGDRVRYRLDAKADWQMGMFQSISAQGLVFATHADAPLDTLPLIALNAVDLDRGKHVDGSRVPFFMTMGLLAGAVILGVAEGSDCGAECGWGALGYVVVGAGVGAAVGLGLALIPVREWERVHGESERRSNPWSSRGLVVKCRF